MTQRTGSSAKQTSEEQLMAAVKFVKAAGGIQKAKEALEELKKLRKTG
jgi:hypothetical protein